MVSEGAAEDIYVFDRIREERDYEEGDYTEGEFKEGCDYETEDESGSETVFSLNVFDILRKGAINLVLPFINGIMLGFGEIFAHEIGFRYGLMGARVQPPRRQIQAQKPKFI